MTQGIRPDGQIFASDASDGELEAFPATARGWGVTVDGKDEAGNSVVEATNGIPPMEWDNGQRNKVDNNIWWLMQHAIPEWQAGNWDAGAFVRYNSVVYYNATDAEISGEPGDSADWTSILPLNGADGRYLQVNNNLSEIAAKGADAQTQARINLGLNDTDAITKLIYPVGAVIMNKGTNPATYLGFGTWTQRSGAIYGGGSVTDSDSNIQTFATGSVSGYFRAHRSHLYSDSISVSVSGTTNSTGGHLHAAPVEKGNGPTASQSIAGSAWGGSRENTTTNAGTSTDGAHTHTVTSSGSFSLGANTNNFVTPGYAFSVWERTA
jgi:hypothetical protein